jgi:tetratricopeptide (TPR) repeat protein
MVDPIVGILYKINSEKWYKYFNVTIMEKKCNLMKAVKIILFLLFNLCSVAQSHIDQLNYGVVLDDPGMRKAVVRKDISYLEDAKGTLHVDIYSPPNLKANDKRPAIIFLNAIGDEAGERKLKSWGIYTTWPQLMAAQGYIGISMETDGSRIKESIQGLFKFLADKGSNYNVDTGRLGVYAASANVSRSSEYLMSREVYKGIKAAVLYYGRPPVGPFRKDLPVLFVISEGDMNSGYNNLWSEVLKNNAPWTIKMGTGMPHAFDAYSDNDEARKLVKETISFWKNHLDTVARPSWKYSKGREVLGSLQMNRPKAMSLLKSLTDENPEDIGALLFYANQLRQDKKYDEAIPLFKKALSKDAKNAQVMVDIAVLFYTKNEDSVAEAYILSAINTGKMKRGDYAELGFYLLAANKNKEAAVYYEKAISISADAFDYYYLARAYAKLNDKENAIKVLGKALINGYGSKHQVDNDHDFDLIRSDDRFKKLLSSIK